MRLENELIRGRDVEIADGDVANVLGPGLVIQDCRVILRVSSRGLIVKAVTFENCEVVAKRKLLNFRWYSAAFRGCKFSGQYVGCGFGRRADHYDPIGHISDCDFSSATLDGCDFMNSDVDSLTLPKWPCFYFLEPLRYRDHLAARAWPGNIKFFIEGVVSDVPPGTSALAFHAASVVKRFGSNEAELHDALQGVPGVLLVK